NYYADQERIINIEENANVNITNNNSICSNVSSTNNKNKTAMISIDKKTTLNINGNLTIEDNTYRKNYTGSIELMAASLLVENSNCQVNIGNGKIYIEKYTPYNTASAAVDNYGVYSFAEGFMRQIAGTAFNTENYFEDIALSSGEGIVMPESNFLFAKSVAKDSFKASTLKNSYYHIAKGSNNSVIILGKEVHIHKICGTATTAECDHDNVHLPVHTKVIEYEELTNETTTLELGKGYYLTESSDPSIKRIFFVPSPPTPLSGGWENPNNNGVYICLNGNTLNNVLFLASGTGANIFICNCSSDEATVTRNDNPIYSGMRYEGIFNHINTYVYGTGNKINFKTEIAIDRSGGAYNQTVEIYNAHFSPIDGYQNTSGRAIVYQDQGGHNVTISNSVFEGYNTTLLLSNRYDNTGYAPPRFGLYNSKIIGNNIISNSVNNRCLMHNNGGILNIENVVFENNTVASEGSGILQLESAFANGSINVSSISFINTNSTGTAIGNLIKCTGGTINATKSYITNNKVDKLIYETGGSVNLKDVDIDDNTTANYLMYIENATTEFNIKNVNVRRNENNSSALFNYGIFRADGLIFENNRTVRHSSIGNEKTMLFDNSIFRDNENMFSLLKSKNAGNLTIKNTKFSNNTVTEHIIHNGEDDTTAAAGNLYIENIEIYNNTNTAENACIIKSDDSSSAVSVNFSGYNYIHDNTAYNIVRSKSNNINFENGTTLFENNTSKILLNIQNYNLNILATATVSAINNTIERINDTQGVVHLGYTETSRIPTVNLYGNLYVVNNSFVGAGSITPTRFDYTPAAVFLGYTSKLNLGNGVLKVYGNTIDNDTHEFNKMYQLFSKMPDGNFINQLDGTTFNENNFVNGIGFVSGTGPIMTGFTKDNSVAEKSFIAATYSAVFSDGEDYRAYKGNSDNVVIGVRKINFNFNPPAGKTVINNHNYPTSLNVGGKTSTTLDYATFEVDGKDFLGWAQSADATVPDVIDGADFATIFGSSDTSQSWTLYAVWGSGAHIHKICGVASESDCNHDLAHLSAHTTVVEYEKLLSETTTLEAGKGYYLASSSAISISRTFTITGKVYICLNGHTLYNVAFVGTNGSELYICNCKHTEASMTQNNSDYMFRGNDNANLSTYLYGSNASIKLETRRIAFRSQSTTKAEFIAYNVNFAPVAGYVNTYNNFALLGQNDNSTSETIISNCTFENYTTTVLISNNSTVAKNNKIK
ncbi:MAG: hypothetical protein IKP66_07535, partial [Lachnospiraceae bacterium]|nr:hypothetical protein [Lachnospiraceae bacterium]